MLMVKPSTYDIINMKNEQKQKESRSWKTLLELTFNKE